MKFKYTIMYVDSVKETLDFYCKAFGFEIAFLDDSGDFGQLDTGEASISFCSRELFKKLGKSPAKAIPNNPVFEIAFESVDVKASLKLALDAGANLIQDVREEPWGQTTSYVSDNNGYLIEICSPVKM